MGGTLPPSLSSHRHHLRFGLSLHTSVSRRGAGLCPVDRHRLVEERVRITWNGADHELEGFMKR
jgi:hypothetical protein